MIDPFGKLETEPQVPRAHQEQLHSASKYSSPPPHVGQPLPTLDKLLDPYHLWPSPHGPDMTRTLLKPMFTASLMTEKV